MYGLIGYPLIHSFSKDYFVKKFHKLGVSENYELLPIQDAKEILTILSDYLPDLKGLNVTIPYKESVIDYLTDIDPVAREIGAVNVIKFIPNNKGVPSLIGYNTDWKGFLISLLPLIKDKPYIKNALILGTGGASKAVAYALQTLGINCRYVSRDNNKGNYTYENLSYELVSSHFLIINTTPLGTYPNTCSYPNIPYDAVTSQHICYDLVYNPSETEFLKKCADKGAKTKNGLEMLYLQADLAWQIWNE